MPRVIRFKHYSSDSNGYDADRTLRLKLTGHWILSVWSSTVRVEICFSSTRHVWSTLTGHSPTFGGIPYPLHCQVNVTGHRQSASGAIRSSVRSLDRRRHLLCLLHPCFNVPTTRVCIQRHRKLAFHFSRKRGTQTHLNPANTTSFVNVPTPPSVSPCAQVLTYFHKHFQGV